LYFCDDVDDIPNSIHPWFHNYLVTVNRLALQESLLQTQTLKQTSRGYLEMEARQITNQQLTLSEIIGYI